MISANAPMPEEMEKWLRADGLLAPGPTEIIPLTGGVSCDIQKVRQGERIFVIKRALEKLRVTSVWHADVSRNSVEARFYEEMAQPLKGHVPTLLFHNPLIGYFVMEYLGQEWSNWKTLLLEGITNEAHGVMAGSIMGKMHAVSWQDSRLASAFNHKKNFRQLRTDPYLRTAAEKLPAVSAELHREADRLDAENTCLIHGDFSPKNLLIKEDRMVLLDAEVAVMGDPAFDLAFLLTHFVIKAVHFESKNASYLAVAEAAWRSYRSTLGDKMTPVLENRAIHLLGYLLLARVDGKSPVEYLDKPGQQKVRALGMKVISMEKPDFQKLRNILSK